MRAILLALCLTACAQPAPTEILGDATGGYATWKGNHQATMLNEAQTLCKRYDRKARITEIKPQSLQFDCIERWRA